MRSLIQHLLAYDKFLISTGFVMYVLCTHQKQAISTNEILNLLIVCVCIEPILEMVVSSH